MIKLLLFLSLANAQVPTIEMIESRAQRHMTLVMVGDCEVTIANKLLDDQKELLKLLDALCPNEMELGDNYEHRP